MREYFQLQAEQRPKIFGMTASPIWNPRDAAESLATLERNLDAKVIAVREHVGELMDHSPKPEEASEPPRGGDMLSYSLRCCTNTQRLWRLTQHIRRTHSGIV